MKLPRRAVLGNQDQVPTGGNPTMQAQPLSQQPLDPVSNDGVPHFLGDRQTEPASALLGVATLHDRQDMATMQLGSPGLPRQELGALSQPHLLGDARRPATRHGEPRYFLAIVTEMRLRPLERRRRRTSRPPRVFLRARNPWRSEER